MQPYDVLVVGKGNAALCAALAAREAGARVAMLEAAPEEESGGNSRFAGGVMRFVYDSVEDLKRLTDLAEEEVRGADWGSNTREEFLDDLFRLTSYRTDPDLSETLVTRSFDTMVWLRSKGVRFVPNYGRQSGVVGGRRRFFGRMPLEVSGGGPGLVAALTQTAAASGIEIHYQTRAVSLIYDGERVRGVHAKSRGKPVQFHARAVVLACGGFEA
ncbi:MAG TPA: FAD-dependent oxidoreductase, partial [Burkholderiales bacterium]|nr:FAD-dependent oxidoreductase [Burkholderiales bacterium]